MELAKRLWPQLWPTLLSELQAVAGAGAVQTQMVMMTLTRLSEDVALLQVRSGPCLLGVRVG